MSHVIVIAPNAATAQTAWAYLQNAGLAPAQPSRRERLTPQQVQALMIKTTQQHRSPQSAALDKIWTELATDLALGNVDAERCGWWQTLDEHTPAFWQRFDPDTRFVLVFEDPTAQTARALTDTLERDTTPTSGTAPDMASALQAWHDQHSQLLDAFFALGADAQLVHTSQLAQAAQSLGLSAQAFESYRKHGITPASAHLIDAGLLHHLLQPLVAAHPAVQSLWPQLQAAAQGPCPDPAPEQQANRQAVGQWLQLQRQSQATDRRLELFAQYNEQLQTRLGDQAAALQTESTAKTQAQQQLQTLQQAQAHQQEQNKRQLQEAQEQGEHLLTQLHQVQEELESHFLKLQEESKAKAELQARLTAETQAKQAEATAKAAAQQQLQTLQKAQEHEQEQNKRQLQEAQEEGELLLTQLHQVQEELENYFLKYQEQRKQYQTVADFWHQHPPAEVWVDMRRTPDSQGWYEAEADGRWSGPGTESALAFPPLGAGQYLVELQIADAMAPELVAGLQLSAQLEDGQALPVDLVHEFGPANQLYPMVSTGLLQLPNMQHGWQLCLALPSVISPAEHGGTDTRQLGLRLQGVRLSLQHADPTEIQPEILA